MLQDEGLPCKICLNHDCLEYAWLESVKVLVKALCEFLVRFRLVGLVEEDENADEDIEARFKIVDQLVYYWLPRACHDKLS